MKLFLEMVPYRGLLLLYIVHDNYNPTSYFSTTTILQVKGTFICSFSININLNKWYIRICFLRERYIRKILTNIVHDFFNVNIDALVIYYKLKIYLISNICRYYRVDIITYYNLNCRLYSWKILVHNLNVMSLALCNSLIIGLAKLTYKCHVCVWSVRKY